MSDRDTAPMNEILLPAAQMRFHPILPGVQASLFFSSRETGRWTVLLRCEKGSALPRHKHYGAGEYYVVHGRMEYVSGVAETGAYGYEPLGSIHDRTSFVEETDLLFTNYGPVAFLDEAGQIIALLDNAYFERLGAS
jgi:anti-sigma factor ChrR (cupin superfamily)